MAISKMKLLSIIGMVDHLDEVVATLGLSGVFHPDDATEFFSESERFVPATTKNEASAFVRAINRILHEKESRSGNL